MPCSGSWSDNTDRSMCQATGPDGGRGRQPEQRRCRARDGWGPVKAWHRPSTSRTPPTSARTTSPPPARSMAPHAAWHRPCWPQPAEPELAKPHRGSVQRCRLHRGLGPADGALPRGQGQRRLVRWRAPSRKPCAPSACARRATAAWPKRACSMWRPPQPSISIVLQPGSEAGPSRPPAYRALLLSPPNRRICHQIKRRLCMRHYGEGLWFWCSTRSDALPLFPQHMAARGRAYARRPGKVGGHWLL